MQADGYRRGPMETIGYRHKLTGPGVESDKHTKQMVCEPHYKRDFGADGRGCVEPAWIKGEMRVDTGGGSVYTYRIRRA